MCQKCVVCFYTRIAMTCAFVMTETPGNPRKPPETPERVPRKPRPRWLWRRLSLVWKNSLSTSQRHTHEHPDCENATFLSTTDVLLLMRTCQFSMPTVSLVKKYSFCGSGTCCGFTSSDVSNLLEQAFDLALCPHVSSFALLSHHVFEAAMDIRS